ncbi:hypothetical protein O3G_MSEX009264 [Manduca sexta]|uniref:Uncharacterized protein n=1 Tax=Manduca sexta TaxID=7130 RepID=A0A922CQF8_MANSE|nr:hypothetical protein O3G_MSEX009264 [Manduca sexta]
MASVKFVIFVAVTLALNSHFAHSQYFGGGYGGYPIYGNSDDDNWDVMLPILLLALWGRGGYGGYGGGFGGYPPIPYGGYGGGCCGGCGGGCGCGCGC